MVNQSEGQQRQVETPWGTFSYTLICKRVRNLNLRIGRDGSLVLSVPVGTSLQRADRMVEEHARWIASHLAAREAVIPLSQLPPLPPREECRRVLQEAVDRVYPLVCVLGVARPELKLRAMKSQWGNCHWGQGYITLNTALARCPVWMQDYVALHELVHFLYHDHGAGFYGAMTALMPDWKERRKNTSRYGALLRE